VDEPAARAGLRRHLHRPLAWVQRVVGVLFLAGNRFFFDRCTQHAAAIGYRVLFSLAPLAIVLVSIVGIVLRDDNVRNQVVDAIVDLLPVSADGRQQVEDAVTAVASPTSLLGVVGLVIFAWTASGMMASVRTGLENAMHVERRPAARSKLVDLLLVMGAGVLVLGLVAATALLDVIRTGLEALLKWLQLDGNVVTTTAGFGVPVLAMTIVVMLLYRFVPARRFAFRDALAGALVTGVLLLALSLASTLVINQALEASAIYGSLATIFVFLYTVYLYACALLFGAEVARAWSEPPPPPDPAPLREKVQRAALGLFVRPRRPIPPGPPVKPGHRDAQAVDAAPVAGATDEPAADEPAADESAPDAGGEPAPDPASAYRPPSR
jgi:membrane protein